MPPNTVNRRDLLRLGLSGVAIPVAALTGAASPVEAQPAVAAVSTAAGNAEPFAASRVTDLARALAAEAGGMDHRQLVQHILSLGLRYYDRWYS